MKDVVDGSLDLALGSNLPGGIRRLLRPGWGRVEILTAQSLEKERVELIVWYIVKQTLNTTKEVMVKIAISPFENGTVGIPCQSSVSPYKTSKVLVVLTPTARRTKISLFFDMI